MHQNPHEKLLKNRFRGFLPVIIDVETAGFNAQTDALLELAAVTVDYNEEGVLVAKDTWHYHIAPFEGANLDPKALEFTGIVPDHPFRFALTEAQALSDLFAQVQASLKSTGCQRAILVGHNASFDLGFLLAATARTGLTRNPFHSFSSFDTTTLSALVFGQTVLAKSLRAAGIEFDPQKAHSALYDAEKTTELFCYIVNRWDSEERDS
jgi:ribonuclease T